MARDPLEIAGVRVVEALSSVSSVFHPWAQVLLNQEYDRSMELRNAAFQIIFFGLFDAAEGADARFKRIRQEAEAAKATTALYYVDFAEKLVDGVIDLLSQFNENETLWLRELRMQTVHGQLQRVHWEKITFPIAANRTVEKISISAEEYWQRFRDFAAPSQEHAACNQLRKRFLEHRSLFWDQLDQVRQTPVLLALQEDVLRNQEPRISWQFANNSYWDAAAARAANGPPLKTLAMYRPPQAPQLARDPVFP